MRLRYTSRAEADLLSILTYIERERPSAARNVVLRIRKSVASLTDFPRSAREGRRPGVREKVVRGLPYVIVYRVDDHAREIVVLNVIHGARNRR